MKRRTLATRCSILAAMTLWALGLAGCSSDIVGYNLRANFSSFLIGVFSDSVNEAIVDG